MRAVILAAGYATRLYPLTKDFPKPLLQAGHRTILDHLMGQLETIPQISAIEVITNHRFARHFEQWRKDRSYPQPVEIIDDGTLSDEERLGALGDLQYAITQRRLDDDLLVCAADNLFQFPLAQFVSAFAARPAIFICVHRLDDLEARRRTGIAELGPDNRVIAFEEKPRAPRSHWAVPPLYLFPRSVLSRLKEYLDAGGTADSPGHFIAWLVEREPVFAHPITGTLLDLGNHDSLERARRLLGDGA